MKTIKIVDPGLRHLAGHHADLDFRIAKEFQRRGADVEIFANKLFASKQVDIDVKSIFSICPYNIVGGYHKSAGNGFNGDVFDFGATIFSRELIRVVDSECMLLFPTLFPCMLEGICKTDLRFNTSVGVLQMAPDFYGVHGDYFWAKALRGLTLFNDRSQFGVLEPSLVSSYESFLENDSVPIHQFPIPYDGATSGNKIEQEKFVGIDDFTVGIFGAQRPSKGKHRLPQLIATLLKAGYKVVVQDSIESVKKVADNPKLRVVGYVENFASLLRECNAVVLDYEVEFYRKNSSGVFWECLASGVPALVPLGTLQSQQVGASGNGLSFKSGDVGSILRKVDTIRDNFGRFRILANYAMKTYHRRNSTFHFVDHIAKDLWA